MAGPVSETMGQAAPKYTAPTGLGYANNAHYLCACECYDGALSETSCLYGFFNTHDRLEAFSLCFYLNGCKYPVCYCHSPLLTSLLCAANTVVCCPVIAAMAVPVSQCDRGYQEDTCNLKGCCYHYNAD